jgi:hypothetical protein
MRPRAVPSPLSVPVRQFERLPRARSRTVSLIRAAAAAPLDGDAVVALVPGAPSCVFAAGADAVVTLVDTSRIWASFPVYRLTAESVCDHGALLEKQKNEKFGR